MSFFLRTFFEDMSVQTKLNIDPVERDVFYRAAHDLRSPLSALNMAVYHIKKLSLDVSCLEMLEETARRINSIAEDILQTRRPFPSTPSQVQAFDLGNVLRTFVRQVQGDLSQRIQLNPGVIPESPLRVRGRDADFIRILWNLTENAIEAGATRLNFQLQAQSKSVILRVDDNGRGIPQRLLKKIGQVGFTTKKTGHGLGVSTALCKLRHWRGDLRIQSTQGIGSRLEIHLSFF